MKLDQDSNIFGDIAGLIKTFDALRAKMPKSTYEISLGDLNDKGPDSKACMDYFMQPDKIWIKGNHEHMLAQIYRMMTRGDKGIYQPYHWYERNKGSATLKSFGIDRLEDIGKIPEIYIDYIESKTLLSLENNQYFLSHAPLNKNVHVDENIFGKDHLKVDASILWNRYPWKRKQDKFFIYGHNNGKDVLWHSDQYPKGKYSKDILPNSWGVCLDTAYSGFLSGLHLPTMKVYQQEIID